MTSPFHKTYTCPACNGDGGEKVIVERVDGDRSTVEVECTTCDGIGEVTAAVYHDYLDA